MTKNRPYPFLNEHEHKVLRDAFNSIASRSRQCTHRYPHDFEIETNIWLELVPFIDNQWLVVTKEQYNNDADRIRHLKTMSYPTYFDAILALSHYEIDKFQKGIVAIIEETDLHYKNIARLSGIAFDQNGLPHPTFQGQIIGDGDFSQAESERSEAFAQQRRRLQESLLPEIIAAPIFPISRKGVERAIFIDELYSQYKALSKIADDLLNRLGNTRNLTFSLSDNGSEVIKDHWEKATSAQKSIINLVDKDDGEELSDFVHYIIKAHRAFDYYFEIARHQHVILMNRNKEYETYDFKLTKASRADALAALKRLGIEEESLREDIVARSILGLTYDTQARHPITELKQITNWIGSIRDYYKTQAGIGMPSDRYEQHTGTMPKGKIPVPHAAAG